CGIREPLCIRRGSSDVAASSEELGETPSRRRCRHFVDEKLRTRSELAARADSRGKSNGGVVCATSEMSSAGHHIKLRSGYGTRVSTRYSEGPGSISDQSGREKDASCGAISTCARSVHLNAGTNDRLRAGLYRASEADPWIADGRSECEDAVPEGKAVI